MEILLRLLVDAGYEVTFYKDDHSYIMDVYRDGEGCLNRIDSIEGIDSVLAHALYRTINLRFTKARGNA